MIKLYPHQEEALNQTKDFNRVAYYLDMGLGKTFVGSEKMKQLDEHINLIVCQKSLIQTWIDHFKTYYKVWVYNLTDKNELQSFKHHVEYKPPFPLVGIINYDLIFRRKFFLQLENYTLMLDESSMVQNEKAKRSKFILQMKPDNVILLSGTPTSGKYENLWSQIHLLGWKISSELYNKQYVNWKKIEVGGFPMKIVDKENPYKNVDRLKQKLRDHGAVFLKTDECFELPEQTFVTINVPTSREYRKFQRNSIITIDTKNSDTSNNVELIGDTTLTKRLYSRMLCGHYNKDKLKAFEDLASSTRDRLIVFYNFNEELAALRKIAQKLDRPISEVSGQVKDLINYENEDNSITFIQYQAGAKGLNLQKANKIIYFTPTDKCEDWMQSKKRIHRIGQNRTCFYYQLICKNSIEERIYEALEKGVDYTDYLFKEYERENDHE